MGAPEKDGVIYFPLDVNFFEDKAVKLIQAEFGDSGVLLIIRLLAEIYRDRGYYKVWDKDDCLLMSNSVAGDRSPAFIAEVVNRCAERSLFDKRVLDMFGVLTSKGIQRRYLTMTGNNRSYIRIIQEYWLLDIADPKDVTPGTLKKLVFKSLISTENPVNLTENPVNLTENPTKEKKEKEKKVNETIAAVRADEDVISEFAHIRPPTDADTTALKALIKQYGKTAVITAIRSAVSKGGRSVKYVERILDDVQRRDPPGVFGPTHSSQDIETMMFDEWFGGEINEQKEPDPA